MPWPKHVRTDYRDDLAFHFNKKVIGALAAIGTREAILKIREALDSPEEPIREFAKKILDEYVVPGR